MDIGHLGATGHNVQLLVVLVLKQEVAHVIIQSQVFLSRMVVMVNHVQSRRGLSLQAAINLNVAMMSLIFDNFE